MLIALEFLATLGLIQFRRPIALESESLVTRLSQFQILVAMEFQRVSLFENRCLQRYLVWGFPIRRLTVPRN